MEIWVSLLVVQVQSSFREADRYQAVQCKNGGKYQIAFEYFAVTGGAAENNNERDHGCTYSSTATFRVLSSLILLSS
jgi:hypothetical protein